MLIQTSSNNNHFCHVLEKQQCCCWSLWSWLACYCPWVRLTWPCHVTITSGAEMTRPSRPLRLQPLPPPLLRPPTQAAITKQLWTVILQTKLRPSLMMTAKLAFRRKTMTTFLPHVRLQSMCRNQAGRRQKRPALHQPIESPRPVHQPIGIRHYMHQPIETQQPMRQPIGDQQLLFQWPIAVQHALRQLIEAQQHPPRLTEFFQGLKGPQLIR